MTEFEEIYRRYFDDVYRYIRKLSGNEDTAEEITSETFFKAMRSVRSFRGECDIRVWLCQIAKNCYYDHIRKRGKTQSIDDEDFPDLADEENIEEQYLKRDEAERIRAALHNVSEPYKEVFMWRVFAQLSFNQIGQIFGKSENWACVTYHRAKKIIRSRLEDGSNEK